MSAQNSLTFLLFLRIRLSQCACSRYHVELYIYIFDHPVSCQACSSCGAVWQCGVVLCNECIMREERGRRRRGLHLLSSSHLLIWVSTCGCYAAYLTHTSLSRRPLPPSAGQQNGRHESFHQPGGGKGGRNIDFLTLPAQARPGHQTQRIPGREVGMSHSQRSDCCSTISLDRLTPDPRRVSQCSSPPAHTRPVLFQPENICQEKMSL